MNKKNNQTEFFLHEDLAKKVILDCRTPESCKFKRKLGFRLHGVINTKQQIKKINRRSI